MKNQTTAGALVLLALAGCGPADPATQEKRRARDAIALCWDDQKKKSLTPDAARFLAGACERMEADFRQKYNASP